MTDTASPPKTRRSGSRAPKNPTTKAQRLVRVEELTERIEARQVEIETLTSDRNRIIRDLRDVDGASFREIALAAGTSQQAIHKAFRKRRDG